MISSKSAHLPKGKIAIKELTDLNRDSNYIEGRNIEAVEFHTSSSVALVAGAGSIASIFHVSVVFFVFNMISLHSLFVGICLFVYFIFFKKVSNFCNGYQKRLQRFIQLCDSQTMYLIVTLQNLSFYLPYSTKNESMSFLEILKLNILGLCAVILLSFKLLSWTVFKIIKTDLIDPGSPIAD